jgi:hypothetical protein
MPARRQQHHAHCINPNYRTRDDLTKPAATIQVEGIQSHPRRALQQTMQAPKLYQEHRQCTANKSFNRGVLWVIVLVQACVEGGETQLKHEAGSRQGSRRLSEYTQVSDVLNKVLTM